MKEKDLWNTERLVLCLDKYVKSGISVGRYRPKKACKPLGIHTHRNRMEIHYLHRGKQTYSINGTVYKLTGGDVLVTFPNEPHDTNHMPQEKNILYWVTFPFFKTQSYFMNLSKTESKTLIQGLNTIDKRIFNGDRQLHDIFDQIIKTYYSDSPYKKLSIKNLCITLFLKIIELSQTASTSRSILIEKILLKIEDTIHEDVTLKDLAAAAGLSITRFQHRFRSEVGIPPWEYLIRKRIEAACHVLKNTDEKITSIAFDLNFRTSQHFSTLFRKIMNQSPQEYRTQNCKKEIT